MTIKKTKSVVHLQDLKKHFAARSFCSPCCHEATNCLYQHSTEALRTSAQKGVWHSSCLCQHCHLKIHSSKHALMHQHSPQLGSQPTVKPALWSAQRGDTVKGYTKAEIAPKPCHSQCINSLLPDGFLGSHTKMPNSRWTKPQDRKFTLFPVFTDDKNFLTVIVLCFLGGMRNSPSTAA